MDLSHLRNRRGVLAVALIAALSRVMPVRAQGTGDCQYTFINGLLTIGGDNCGIAVPGHMVDATNNSLNDDFDGSVGSNVDSPNEIRQDRLYDRRNRRRTVRSRHTDQKQTQRGRRHERKILCEDFSNQFDAVEAMAQNPWAAKKLDPDGDGIPCEDLRALTCDEFSDEAEAVKWFQRMGYSKEYDPFKLYDAETSSVCTFRATCDDFSSQKKAVEWLTDNPVDRKRLDPDNDWAPCQQLDAVTCKAFSTIEEAKAWFTTNGFTQDKDPYKLYNKAAGVACPELACAKFTTQKAAIEWLTDHPEYQQVLDPNNDKLACTHLTTVTCSQFGSSAEVLKWHEKNNITGDPFGLFDTAANPQRYCSKLPATLNG